MTKINLEEVLQKFEELSSYVAGIDREELKKQFTREELKAFNDKLSDIKSNSLWYDVHKIIDAKKLEEYPELLQVHNFPVLKEIDFMTEEQKIKLDERMSGFRVGESIGGISRFVSDYRKLEKFLVEKGVAERFYYLQCSCEEMFLSDELSEEDKVKLEVIMKKEYNGLTEKWTKEDKEFYDEKVQEYCADCYAASEYHDVNRQLERGQLYFKEILKMKMKRDDSLDNV